jgi:glycyl-tRNA synthetase
MEKKKDKVKTLAETLKERCFVFESWDIYNGVAGFFDFGPPGCALKNNIEACWREHFILEDNMLEISGPCITPEVVFKASVFLNSFSYLIIGTC